MISHVCKTTFSDLSGPASVSFAIGHMMGELYDAGNLPDEPAIQGLLEQLGRPQRAHKPKSG